MRENVCDATFSQNFSNQNFPSKKSARNLIQNASMFALIFSVKFRTLIIVGSGKSKKILLLKSFFFGLPILSFCNASKQNRLSWGPSRACVQAGSPLYHVINMNTRTWVSPYPFIRDQTTGKGSKEHDS